MSQNTHNIKYEGQIPVRKHGVKGEIMPGQTFYFPEDEVVNLILDKNWKRYTPPVEPLPEPQSESQPEPPEGNPPEEKKERKRGGK